MSARVAVFSEEECIRETFDTYLSEQGLEVLTFSEAPRALLQQINKCQSEKICVDFIFVDKSFSQVSPFSFVRRIQSSACKINSRNIIIMTGSPTEEDFEAVKQLGCQILIKPFLFDQIDQIIAGNTVEISHCNRSSPCFCNDNDASREQTGIAVTA